MRKQIVAANWKMNLTLKQAGTLLTDIIEKDIPLSADQEVIIGVPFPYMVLAQEKLAHLERYQVAAQNCYTKPSGAFTGEVSAAMIASCGVSFVIIGHSERREYFNEDHEVLAEKIDECLINNLKPIFCCGEPLEIREAGTQNEFVEKQIRKSLFHLNEEQMTNFIVAYEPIWAIGTGKTASSDQAQEMHAHIRNVLSQKYGSEVADTISILYGGSVKANNAAEIFGKPDVDGGLVGGASLNADEFESVIKGLK
ncbi:MAG: triose-phosphate isomerase [Ginsengibacter sp.]|jgi:triosephosphate isomerase